MHTVDMQAFANLNSRKAAYRDGPPEPIHNPCIQWITRHLLLLTAESKLHSPTLSLHTVDLEAYCYFHPMTNKDDFYMGPHACCDPSFIQSLLIRMLHLQPTLRCAQSVPPQLTS